MGRYGQVEMETLLSLRPDLVLLWPDSVPRSQREQLQQFGIPVLVVAQTRLDGLAEQFRVIGGRSTARSRASAGRGVSRRPCRAAHSLRP